jgi:3-hydroxyisobutyrate dehydrogenase
VATIAPAESRHLALALQQRGASYLETPVLGSRPEALASGLQVMLGGEMADDYANPNFPTAHLRKDLQLFLDAATGATTGNHGPEGPG